MSKENQFYVFHELLLVMEEEIDLGNEQIVACL
jgi:hypothetical protein